MSKESGAPLCSTSVVLSQADPPSVALHRRTSPLPSPTLMAPLPAEDTAHVETLTPVSSVRSTQVDEDYEGNVAEQRDSTDKRQLTESPSASGIRADQGEAAQEIGRYEYMDIRRSDSPEGEDTAGERRGSQTSAKSAEEAEEADQMVEVLKKEHGEEEVKYHNTNKQPTLQGNLSGMLMPRPDVLPARGEKMEEEYEEMTRLGVVPSGWEQVDYQNLPVKGRAVSEETGSGRCAGIGGYIKVCAGIREPGSNTSFDNPDYWHSRLFLKPDAVRT